MELAPQTEKQNSINYLKNIIARLLQSGWLASIALALLAFMLVKGIFIDIVVVGSKDMRSTYEQGDVLLVKKALNFYHVNDVLYFEYPVKDSGSHKQFFVQRLAGMPGDSVAIRGKALYINNVRIQDTMTLKNNYFIGTRNCEMDSLFKNDYHLTEGGQISNNNDYSYSLTRLESELLRRDSAIKKVELKTEKPGNFDETCFPYSPYYKWNMDHYGSIYIPKKHDTLLLDSVNIVLYAAIIQNYEHNTLELRHDSILINGELSRYYVARKNYFFVLGDNRDNANDSRVWGFLPQDFIAGKILGRIKRAAP